MIVPDKYRLQFLGPNEHTVERYIELYEYAYEHSSFPEPEERIVYLHNIILLRTILILNDHCE
jgi:hypothetical protein